MKTAIKIALCFAVVVTTYLLIFWRIFAHMSSFKRMGYMPSIVSWLVALIIATFIWRKMGNFANSLFAYVLGGGIALGLAGFILGFFGPIILSPSSNQGPLLGIFLTGPVGFFVGLFLGGVYWNTKVKNKKNKLLE